MIVKLWRAILLWSLGVDAASLRGPAQKKAKDDCEDDRELPSAAALKNHPIGPHYSGARKQLDRLAREMAKLGTNDTPNFDMARHSVYDQALRPSR